MKKKRDKRFLIVTGLSLAAVCALFFLFTGQTRAVDVVHDISPVSRDMRDIRATLDTLTALPAEQREAALRRDWPNLEKDIVCFLRLRGKLPEGMPVEKVEFFFGSLDRVSAADGDGNVMRGYFRNQLVAKVYVPGRDPESVIVQCLNGLFALERDWKTLQTLGTYQPIQKFTIAKGEGLVHHVGFTTAVALAERFNLPLYQGQDMGKSNLITPAQARSLQSQTDRIQVTTRVFEGDVFDLVSMKYTPSSARQQH